MANDLPDLKFLTTVILMMLTQPSGTLTAPTVVESDDSSLSVSGKNSITLNEQIKTKYPEISEYMAANRLVLNTDKTHFLVIKVGRQ